jgi:hypothetical protein
MVSVSGKRPVDGPRRWPIAVLVLLAIAALVVWWVQRGPGDAARYRLDAAAVRALPADAAGDERLLRHLGSLMRDDAGSPWQELDGPQRAVVVALTFEGMASRMGLAGYAAFLQRGQQVPTLDEIVESYEAIGCPDAAGVAGDARALIASHAWPPAADQARTFELRLRSALDAARGARRAFAVQHAEEIAAPR